MGFIVNSDTHHHSCRRLTVSKLAEVSVMLTSADDQTAVTFSRSPTGRKAYCPPVTNINIDQTELIHVTGKVRAISKNENKILLANVERFYFIAGATVTSCKVSKE